MSFWIAARAPMPPAPSLRSAVADWTPSIAGSVAWFAATAGFAVLSVVLVAVQAYAFLLATLPLTALGLAAWIAARRTHAAVGDGWLYVRTGLAGGCWTYLSDLESGKVTGKGGTTLLLRGPSFRGRVPVAPPSMRRPTAFHRELGRQLLAQSLDLDAQGRFVLRSWAGTVSPGPRDD